MNTRQFIHQIRDRIARDELEQALSQLRQFLANAPQLDEVLQQSGRFAAIRRQVRLGTVSHEDATLTRNQIRVALLDLLSEIDTRQAQSPALGAEAAHAISILQSKNVVAGSTISGQTVHIGDVVYQNAPPEPAASPTAQVKQLYTRRFDYHESSRKSTKKGGAHPGSSV